MPIENCGCGGNNIDRFYSLFTCDHANCVECHWTNNKCCLGCYVDTSCTTGDCSSGCINYYDIPMQDVITSKIKSIDFPFFVSLTPPDALKTLPAILAVIAGFTV